MHSTIDAKMETLKHDLYTKLESFIAQICAKLNITEDLTSSDPPLHPKGETSSNSQTF